jgi:hypothetical protein
MYMFKRFMKFLGGLLAIAITAFVTGFASTKGAQFAGAKA